MTGEEKAKDKGNGLKCVVRIQERPGEYINDPDLISN